MSRNALRTALDTAAEYRARIATLEAENAALREGLDSILSRYVGTLDAGAGNYDGKAYAESLPEVQRARALLQGGPDAG